MRLSRFAESATEAISLALHCVSNTLKVLFHSNFVPSSSPFNLSLSLFFILLPVRHSLCNVPFVVPHCLFAVLLVLMFLFHLSKSSVFSVEARCIFPITSSRSINFSLINFSPCGFLRAFVPSFFLLSGPGGPPGGVRVFSSHSSASNLLPHGLLFTRASRHASSIHWLLFGGY